MAAGNDTALQEAIRSRKLSIDKKHPHLSAEERNAMLHRQVYNMVSTASSPPTSSVPQKRHSGSTQFESGPHPKRSAAATASLPSSAYLQRHISAPAGSGILPTIIEPTQTRPINIPQKSYKHTGRQPLSLDMFNSPQVSTVYGASQFDNEFQDLSPAAYLALQNEPWTTSAYPSTAPEFGHGRSYDIDNSTTFFDNGCNYSSATVTSSSSVTSASFGENMVRTDTCDQMYDPFAMLRVDSENSSINECTRGMATGAYAGNSPQLDDADIMQFSFVSSVSKSPLSSTRSQSQRSKEPGLSSSSESLQSFSSISQTVHDQNVQPKVQRALAPKKNGNGSKQGPVPKIVTVRGEDGISRPKAEIPRAARQPQQRKTTFCAFCNDQPQGFHGDHELRRHIERQHTQLRKVWVCRDISEGSQFLRNCKACRNNKTYGANYNAAAHLRRTHFNPCKNKRGGRNKKSEGRGGMGGGNSPSMDELKNWMFETYEVNSGGRVIVQSIAPDVNIPQIPMSDLSIFDGSEDISTTTSYDTDVAAYCGTTSLPMGNDNMSYNDFYGDAATQAMSQMPSSHYGTNNHNTHHHMNNMAMAMPLPQYYGQHFKTG